MAHLGGTYVIFILSAVAGAATFGWSLAEDSSAHPAANLYGLTVLRWSAGDHASEDGHTHLLVSLRCLSGNTIRVSLSLYSFSVMVGCGRDVFLIFLESSLFPFHSTDLGLSRPLPRSLCVQVWLGPSPHPVAHAAQAAIWSCALAHRVQSLLCNSLFLSWFFSPNQCAFMKI